MRKQGREDRARTKKRHYLRGDGDLFTPRHEGVELGVHARESRAHGSLRFLSAGVVSRKCFDRGRVRVRERQRVCLRCVLPVLQFCL